MLKPIRKNLVVVGTVCILMLVITAGCQTKPQFARMKYTALPIKNPDPVTSATINVTRFFDMRGEKTGLMTPESRKRQVVGILCNEDLGNWVTNAVFEEFQVRGYNVKLMNAVDVPEGEYEIGGYVHMVEYERGGQGFYFKVLLNGIVKYNNVVLWNRQYFSSVGGNPSLKGVPKSFEKSLRKAINAMLSDLESLFVSFEGIQS